jgi:hypothetical protein
MAIEENRGSPAVGWSLPSRVRPLFKAASWLVGCLTILLGLAGVSSAIGYPPEVAAGILAVAAGAVVLPPVSGALRKSAPILRPVWAPPAAYLLILLMLQPASRAFTPHGAAREAYINKAIAAADAQIKAHRALEARADLSFFPGDAATRPALKAAFARVAAEQAVEAGESSKSSTPARSVSPQDSFNPVDAALTAASAPCQDQVAMTWAVRFVSSHEAYKTASSASQACLTASRTTAAMKFSDPVSEPWRDKLNQDVADCSSAYLTESLAMDALMKVLDGNDSQSAVELATDELNQVTMYLKACQTAYRADAVAAGFKRSG